MWRFLRGCLRDLSGFIATRPVQARGRQGTVAMKLPISFDIENSGVTLSVVSSGFVDSSWRGGWFRLLAETPFASGDELETRNTSHKVGNCRYDQVVFLFVFFFRLFSQFAPTSITSLPSRQPSARCCFREPGLKMTVIHIGKKKLPKDTSYSSS